VLIGAAWGESQPASLDDQGIYTDFVATFVADLTAADDLGGRILAAAQTGAGLDGGGEGFNVCATLAGTGGNPRMDGGGGNPRMDGGGMTTLAPFPAFGPRWPYAVAEGYWVALDGIAVADVPGRPVAVIDVFRFEEGDLEQFDGETGLQVHDLWRILIAGFLQESAEEGSVPHGHLVLFHLLASWAGKGRLVVGYVLGADGPDLRVSAPSWPDDWSVSVHLLGIEYDKVTTIANAMSAARLIAQESTSDLLVVTSWGLVDCTLDAAYLAPADPTTEPDTGPADFADYVATSLASSPEQMALLAELCWAFRDEIAAAVGVDNVPCHEPKFLTSIGRLLTYAALAQMDARARRAIDWSGDVGTTVVLASAGNQGLPFPMPPAAWPGVVGVEACMVGDWGAKAEFSNVGTTGELGKASARALGAWFSTPEVASDGSTPLGYWGTSFAAPAAAAAFAGVSWTPSGLEVVDPCAVGQP